MPGVIADIPKGALETSEDSTAIFRSLAGHVPRCRLITIPVPAFGGIATRQGRPTFWGIER
jgi:hypothetical protein